MSKRPMTLADQIGLTDEHRAKMFDALDKAKLATQVAEAQQSCGICEDEDVETCRETLAKAKAILKEFWGIDL